MKLVEGHPSPDSHGDHLVPVATPTCFACGEAGVLYVSLPNLLAWQAGALIQDAFPALNVDAREQLISGTHPACWDAMFSEE